MFIPPAPVVEHPGEGVPINHRGEFFGRYMARLIFTHRGESKGVLPRRLSERSQCIPTARMPLRLAAPLSTPQR